MNVVPLYCPVSVNIAISNKIIRNNVFFISDTKHVMISYQWDVQKLVIQLKNKLQADGYKVWMDIDEMGGSTLESMARAVENASVVLVCVSQKYKESPNCRSGRIIYSAVT